MRFGIKLEVVENTDFMVDMQSMSTLHQESTEKRDCSKLRSLLFI